MINPFADYIPSYPQIPLKNEPTYNTDFDKYAGQVTTGKQFNELLDEKKLKLSNYYEKISYIMD